MDSKIAVRCSKCGAENAIDLHPCNSCGAQLTPVESQVSPLTSSGTNNVGGYRIARLGDRFIAVVIDSILIASLFAVVGMWTAARWGGLTEMGFEVKGTPALIAILATLLFGFLYYWILEGVWGVTLGKVIIGIQVRKGDGAPSDMRSSLIRNLLRIPDGIGVYLVGFLVAVFSRLRQRIGDHLAGTAVLEMTFGKALRAGTAVIWFAAILGGLWGAYQIHTGVRGTAAAVKPSVLMTGDLKIVKFVFLQTKGGPERPETPFKPGEKIYTSYDVAGFTTNSQGQLHLLFTVVAYDPTGLPLLAPLKYEMNQAISKSDNVVNGYFNFDLPAYVQTGRYKIEIKVEDAIKNTNTEFAPAFRVEAVPISPAARLEYRDCRLSLSKDGPPAATAVIQVGGTIYSSCRVAGMQFREDRPDVQISLQVIGPRGQMVYDKPDLMHLNDSCPYHPATFFEEISARVTLPSDASKGEYVWKYVMTDRIANTTANYEEKFEVR